MQQQYHAGCCTTAALQKKWGLPTSQTPSILIRQYYSTRRGNWQVLGPNGWMCRTLCGWAHSFDTSAPLGYSLHPMTTLTGHIKTRARQLGFDLVGVTEPDRSGDAEFYGDWLGQGYHAEMAYLARQDAIRKRADPRLLFPGTRSILVVGMNYYPGEFPPAQGARGRVSRYAWGVDYHAVMLEAGAAR